MGKFDYAEYFPESSKLKKFGVLVPRKDVTVGRLLERQFEIYRPTLAPNRLGNRASRRLVDLRKRALEALIMVLKVETEPKTQSG